MEGSTAFVVYQLTDDGLDIRQTRVLEVMKGKGIIASTLVKTAYDYVCSRGLELIAICSYAVRWLEQHPEYEL